MVKILTLERENDILVQSGMDFARGVCLFAWPICLVHVWLKYC